MNRGTQLAIVAFAVVFVVVFAAVGVAGIFDTDDPDEVDLAPDVPDIDNPQYDAAQVSVDSTPGAADVEMQSAEFNNEVVIHLGGAVGERDVAPLTNALTREGHEVTIVESIGAAQPVEPIPIIGQDGLDQTAPPPDQGVGELTGQLDEAHGLISLGVAGYSDADLEAISEFVDDGGHVVMGVDPAQEFAMGAGLAETYNEFGVWAEPGYVYNLHENDLNYQRIFTEPAGESVLTRGVDRAVFDTATPVQAVTTDETMEPVEGSELSTTREPAEDPVLVRDGGVVLVGDTGFMSPENVQRADNDVLVGNIADFLVEADRVVTDDPANDDPANDGPANDAPPDDDEAAETVRVAVGPDGENRFEPDITEIEPGTTVEFVWESDGHNIVPVFADPEEWLDEFGVEEPQDEGFTYEFTFEEEGFVEFVSEEGEQDGMFGAVVVSEH